MNSSNYDLKSSEEKQPYKLKCDEEKVWTNIIHMIIIDVAIT